MGKVATMTIVKFKQQTATVAPAVNVKYARKLVQDQLKKRNVYGCTVWHEETKDGVMHFKITGIVLTFMNLMGAFDG